MESYEVVFVLVNYNGLEDTRACLESLKMVPENHLIVLVDNASDDSDEVHALQTKFRRLIVLGNKRNLGFGVANNVGIQWALENTNFRYICLLNNDTVVTPNFLLPLKEAFSIHPDIGMTTGKIMYLNNDQIVWYGGGEIDYRRGWPSIVDFNSPATTEGANNSKYVSFASGCLMMFTRESIGKLQGFDQRFFMYCEDLELCIRVREMGMRIYYKAESVIFHRVQGAHQNDGVSLLKADDPRYEFVFVNMRANQLRIFLERSTGLARIQFLAFYTALILRDVARALKAGQLYIIPALFKLRRQIKGRGPWQTFQNE